MAFRITTFRFSSVPSVDAALALNEFFEDHDVTPAVGFGAGPLVVADGSADVRGQAIDFQAEQIEELDRLAFEFGLQYVQHRSSNENGSELRWTDGEQRAVGARVVAADCFDPVFSANEVLALSGRTFSKPSEILALLGARVPQFVAGLVDRRESIAR